MATHLQPYAAVPPVYGNTGAPISNYWYTIDPSVVDWYGMEWTSTTSFRYLTFRIRNTSTTSVYRFQLFQGAALGTTSEVYSAEVRFETSSSTGVDFKVTLPKRMPAGTYHFRLTSMFGSFVTTQIARNTAYSAGNAVFQNKGDATLQVSATDVVFSYWDDTVLDEEFVGNDAFNPTGRGLIAFPSYSGMEFATTKNVSELHVALSIPRTTNLGKLRVAIHKGYGATAPVHWDSGLMDVRVPEIGPIYWVPVVFPDVLPAGEYQFRLYGETLNFHYLGSTTGAKLASAIDGTATTQVKPGYYEIAHRIVLSNAVSANAPKRWTGTEWMGANVRRWDGTKWVGSVMTAVKPMPRRYWDVSQYNATIDAATVEGMFTSIRPMEEAYGTQIGRYLTQTQYNSYTIDAISTDPNAKEDYKEFIDELAKYPAAFVASANRVNVIVMAPNLRLTTSGTIMGGVAYDTAAGYCFVNTIVTDGKKRFGDVGFVLHHELCHLLSYSWGTEFNAIKAEFDAINPRTYIGDNYTSVVGRPAGFLRPYSLHSFGEDVADIVGMLMCTSQQEWLATIIAEDPVVAKKIAIVKSWFATKDPAFKELGYWTSIHS